MGGGTPLKNISLMVFHFLLSNTMNDQEILEFYLKNKEENSDLFQSFTEEKRLRNSELFKEAKGFVNAHRGDILQQMRRKIIGKSKMEKNPR